MDRRLLDWARAVKARRKGRVPALWLFTDSRRLPDPRAAIARLPRGAAGVVLRHDADPGRPSLGRALARLSRARRLALVVAGDARLAASLGAGVHLRNGRWPGPARPKRRGHAVLTSSAHDAPSLRRAARAGVDLVFLSPAFPTETHPGAPSLGPLRWARLARGHAVPVAALGGVNGRTARRLPRIGAGAGAIGALAPPPGASGHPLPGASRDLPPLSKRVPPPLAGATVWFVKWRLRIWFWHRGPWH